MANTDAPNGFRPVMHLNGAPYNGQSRKYVCAEDMFMGDLVELTGADADGYAMVGRCDSGSDVVVGAVVGWAPSQTALTNLYCASGSVVYVADSPDLIFEAQQDDGTITDAGVGLNAQIVAAAGSTSSGVSNMEVDGSTVATTNTFPLRIMGFVDRIDNDRASSYSKLLVTINTHQYANGSTGI